VPVAGEPFARRDVLLALALMAGGLILRAVLWSGYGLGDDPILKAQFVAVLRDGRFIADNQGYRVTWWLPTLASARVFGLNEYALIWPVTIMSALGIGVVYAIGHQLYGRAGAMIAALLLAVHPFDVVWAGLFSSDYFCSVALAVTMWCVLRATSHPDVAVRRRAWIGAVLALVAAYHAKVSAAVLLVPIAAILFMRRRDLGRELWTAVAWGAVLGGLVLFVYWALTGNPLAPLELEVRYQGLIGEPAKFRLATWNTLEIYPRQLLQTGPSGDYVYGFYPHLFVVFVLFGWLLRLRTAPETLWWTIVLFLVLEFNFQRANGDWVAGFRNIRHLHGIVYPMMLALAGYFVSMRKRWPTVATALVAVLVLVTLAQAITLGGRVSPVFADRRTMAKHLLALAPGVVWGDVAMHMRWELENFPPNDRWRYAELTDNEAARKPQLEAIADGYLITGMGQEPFYGCPSCIIRAVEVPPDRFELLLELPGPEDGTGPHWRPERARLWKRKPSAPPSGSGSG
jgi:4-amino-4-deoxy-L-arabinose transferase-like glycosyltransferase